MVLTMLKEIQIKNHEPFHNCVLKDLQPVNIIVGPPGSGKTRLFFLLNELKAGYYDVTLKFDTGEIVKLKDGIPHELERYLSLWNFWTPDMELFKYTSAKAHQEAFLVFRAMFGSIKYWSRGLQLFFGLLLALYNSEPNSIIFFEHPETNLGPREITQFMEHMRLVQKEKNLQVFITTHSRDVVDLARPEELLFLKDGKCYKIDPSKIDAISDSYVPLGDLWSDGFLEHFIV